MSRSPLPLCPSCGRPRGFPSAGSGWRGEQSLFEGEGTCVFLLSLTTAAAELGLPSRVKVKAACSAEVRIGGVDNGSL